MEKNTTSRLVPRKGESPGNYVAQVRFFPCFAADGIHFKPFNSWIRNPTSDIALVLHLLTSAFYAIVTHTYNYNYSLRNFRKFQFNVPGSNEPVRSK